MSSGPKTLSATALSVGVAEQAPPRARAANCSSSQKSLDKPTLTADNSDPDASDRQLCLHQIFENWAARTPDAVAVVFGGQTMSYRELNRRANALAQRLIRDGVNSASLVGISMKRSLEMMIGLLAILKTGAAYVPLDPKLPCERLRFLITDASLKHVLTNGTALDVDRVHLIDLSQDPAGDHYSNDVDVAAAITNRDLVYVIYTSGSTGEPKGVMVPHQGVVNWLVWMRKVFAATPQDAVLSKAPLSFDVSAWELFLPLISGARLILADSDRQYDQRYLADLMASTGVTIAQFVPSLMRAFLEQKTLPRLGALRHVMCGGEVLTPKLASLFLERLPAELCNSYGPTEASIGVTRWRCRRGETRASIPIGYAIDNVELYILDPDLNQVRPGEPGELYIAGICLARGYLNRPELTAERFVRNPFSTGDDDRMYRTGDLCRLLEDGSIDFIGRTDDQVKVRGVRIELPEIEKSLMTHPAVGAAAVTVDHADDTATLVAFVVPAMGQPLTDRELRAFLRQRLPLAMVPSEFYFVTGLPISANGKLDRKQLRIERTRPTTTERTGDAIDQRVAAIWAEVLERDDFGPDDDFFDCGGDSFSAMQLYLRIEEEFRRPVDLDALGTLTIANLSRFVRGAPGTGNAAFPAQAAKVQHIGRVVCRMATLDDVEGIWRVCTEAFPAYANSSYSDFEALCRHRWLNNPARTADDPFGWVLQADSGEIVGFHGLVPTRLHVGGQAISAISPTTWAARPGYGSAGFALLSIYLDWGANRFLLNTTANAITSAMHAGGNRGMRPIPLPDFDQRLIWIMDAKTLLRWKLAQKKGGWRSVALFPPVLWMAAGLAPMALGLFGGLRAAVRATLHTSKIGFENAELETSPIDRFGPEFDALWHRLKDRFDVVSDRSAEILNWRHIAPPRLLGRSHAIACREKGELLGYIALRQPANTAPGHVIVTDLFYDPSRRDVMHSLMNAAFEYAAMRATSVFEVFGFHPLVNAELRTQNPFVLRRVQLEQLGRNPSLRGTLAALLRRSKAESSTYWYRAPSEHMQEVCSQGTWWPSGIDGDLNL